MLLSVKWVTSVWAGSRPPVQSSNTVRSPWLMEYMNWLLLGSLQDTGQIGLNKARSHVSLRKCSTLAYTQLRKYWPDRSVEQGWERPSTSSRLVSWASMLLDLGAKAPCGQQLALRPWCFLAVNSSTLSQVALGVAVVILGLFWRYLREKMTIWEVVLERDSGKASICVGVTYLITNNSREPNVGDHCTSSMMSWMQLLCSFLLLKVWFVWHWVAFGDVFLATVLLKSAC